MLRPIRRGKPRGDGSRAVTPLNIGGDGRAASSSEVSGPQEPSSGAAVGRFVEAPSHGVPKHRPALHGQVRKPTVEMVVESKGMQPRGACTESGRLQVVASDAGSFLRGARRTHEVHNQAPAHGLSYLRVASARGSEESARRSAAVRDPPEAREWRLRHCASCPPPSGRHRRRSQRWVACWRRQSEISSQGQLSRRLSGVPRRLSAVLDDSHSRGTVTDSSGRRRFAWLWAPQAILRQGRTRQPAPDPPTRRLVSCLQ